MKKLLIPVLFSLVISTQTTFGQGFPASPVNWPIVIGGFINGGTPEGFNQIGDGSSAISYDIGSQNWAVMDINGDGKPDLVIAGELMASGHVTDYSPSSNPYWKVHLNNGSGFSASVTNWPVPVGGIINGGIPEGFNQINDGPYAFSYDIGSQNWAVMDMNGDGKPDLVITGEHMASGHVTDYSPSSNPYWKVYLNTGSGFSGTVTNWPVVVGGIINSGVPEGYNLIDDGSAAFSFDVGTQNWTVTDMNGDGKPDLVIAGEQMPSGFVTDYSPSSNPYWKVYLNNGSGFSGSVTNWPVVVGGEINSGTPEGFNMPDDGSAAISYDIGSQNWTLMDMNGDGKPDLVIASEHMASGHVTDYSPSSNPYWKVHLNTGSGFSGSVTNWAVPVGGDINGGTPEGFKLIYDGSAISYDIGSQNWSVMDINGDGKPDMIVTSQNMASGHVTDYSPSSNPYWKVYLNTGSGFSGSVTNWSVPVGGTINAGTPEGFKYTGDGSAISYDIGSQNFTVMDINGDGKPDMIVTGELMASGHVTDYSPSSSPYWKVYMNPTGVDEIPAAPIDFSAYPNPFSQAINIDNGTTEQATVTMFNMMGQNIGTWQIDKGLKTISTETYPTGVYILQVKTKDGILNKKLMKVN